MSRRQFRIIQEIAEGGFGRVYLAERISSDHQFSRVVALKLLHERWSNHDEVISRTRDEARLLGLLRNDHIVRVEDLTSINGQCAIVMEYLEGVDLRWLIRFLARTGRRLPLRSAVEIVQAAADALASAYDGVPLQSERPLRVIHRDIKPSNILVTTTGQVKVLDFGTARASFARREAHSEEIAFGSQGYMAPERLLGDADTPASDVFGLGVTMYELLALQRFGRIPPRPEAFDRKLGERIAVLAGGAPGPRLGRACAVLRSMLAYDPADRPSAHRVVELMELLASEAVDMPLRRFARTVVVEAREAMPRLDTGDGLVGSIVEEDHRPSPDPAPRPAERVDPPPRRRRLLPALVLSGLAAALLATIGVAGSVIADVLGEEPAFVVDDRGRDADSMVRTTLSAAPSRPFTARFLGHLGFRATWTGPTPIALDLPAGPYATAVRPREGAPIRGQTLELTGRQCVVTLDLTAERWETDCN